MTTDTHRARVDALFEDALEVPEESRPAFLHQRCGTDAALSADVARLLDLVDRPAPDLDDAQAPQLLPQLIEERDTPWGEPEAGDRIGAWRIVRRLGRGGMGVVFLVERGDGQFMQTAALKLVRRGLDSEQIVRRFERERQILASLTHTCIARLLDGGRTPEGCPYFVMEYVEGRPIDQECDVRGLTIAERFALFERLCRAVQHAHSRLVVHRDVKPSNVVVTTDGEVKLLDFGIARLLEPTSAPAGGDTTDALARILTPDYASPEQVRGDPVATSSDVYQLGLLLYELLTGNRAQHVDGRSLADLERGVCATPPVRPSERVRTASDEVCRARGTTRAALVRALRGDVDTIVACALRKEADRRYASVGDLIEDLQRLSHGLPLRAHGDGIAYRARKFATRHRAALAAAAAALATVSLVLPVLVGQRLQAAREQQRARQIEDMLARVFTLPNPRFLARPPSAADFVDEASRLVRSDLGEQPASQARLLADLGAVYRSIGRYDRAIDVMQAALVLSEQPFVAESLDAAGMLQSLAQSQHYAGRYGDAERSLRRAREIRVAGLGPAALLTLSVDLDLGDLMHTRGQLVEAERVLGQAIRTLRTIDASGDVLSRALRDRGNVLRDRGSLAAAAASHRESIELLRAQFSDPNQQIAVVELDYARLLVRQHAHAEAEALLTRNLRDLRLLFGGEHPLTGIALATMGLLRTEQQRFDEAAASLENAQRILLAWLGADHPMVARTGAIEAELARRRGRPSESIAIARRTLGHFERLGLSGHPAAIETRCTLGEALLARRRPAAAAAELTACLAEARQQFIPGDARIAAGARALDRAMTATTSRLPAAGS